MHPARHFEIADPVRVDLDGMPYLTGAIARLWAEDGADVEVTIIVDEPWPDKPYATIRGSRLAWNNSAGVWCSEVGPARVTIFHQLPSS